MTLDNLVLNRVATALDANLAGAIVREVDEQARHRFRLILHLHEKPRSVIVSVDPERPWIGRPGPGRGRPGRGLGSPFAAECRRRLRGVRLRAVDKPAADRRVDIRFVDGQLLVAELSPPRPNLVLVDGSGRVVAAARNPKGSRQRLRPGAEYCPPSLPPGRLDPFVSDAMSVDRQIDERVAGGESRHVALVRGCQGIGKAAAALVVEESRDSGRTVGTVLVARLAELAAGRLDPLAELPREPGQDERSFAIHPWPPTRPPAEGSLRTAGEDAGATAGLFYETLERSVAARRMGRGLVALLGREIARLRLAERRVAADLARFADPERNRRYGEAILAGLHAARRAGDTLLVPDPYDPEGGTLAIPVAAGTKPSKAAQAYFDRHRRALRGLERGRRRRDELAARRTRLERAQVAHGEAASHGIEPEHLERALRAEGIAVGLECRAPGATPAARPGRVRVEGVRLYPDPDGRTLMVGKHGQGNHRLTFRLAAPEDFWFHALGVAGAHVVLRNDDRSRRPGPAALERAAAAAAWYSEASRDGMVDVQWTRRKYVRQIRGAAPGTVTIKRFETVRVRPRPPLEPTGAGEGPG